MTDVGADAELTRSERRRAATHRALQDAVIELLLETGHNRLSTTAIAERADVAVGTFYNHFLSVPDAIDTTFESVAQDFVDAVAEALQSDDVATGLGVGLGGFFCRLNEAPRIWKAARIAGWEVSPIGDYTLVRGLIAAGVGPEDATEQEIAATAHLLCRLMTAFVDQFGEPDVDPQLPGQATRVLASAVMSDAEAVERAVIAAEQHYRDVSGRISEAGPFHLRPS